MTKVAIFTFDTMLALHLDDRISDNEAGRICYYLKKNAAPEDRRAFDTNALRNAYQVFGKAADMTLQLTLVADAIHQGADKKSIADELRALGARCVASSPSFVNQPEAPVQSSAPAPPNAIASGFEAANRTVTAAEFIADTQNSFLQEICTALNNSERYADLLELFGVQPSLESNRHLAQLRERWNSGRLTGNRGNPALTLLTDLCASPKFAALPLNQLADRLLQCRATAVQSAVGGWILAMAEGEKAQRAEIQVSVDRHEELRAFFLKHKLAADEAEVQKFIDQLTADDVDVHTVEHMRRMNADDFRTAGFSLRLSKDIAAAVEQHFK